MAKWCAENLRDCQAWRDEGLPVTTTSNEAAKLFDALLRQYVSWIDCEQLGGIEKTAAALTAADPEAIMGRVLTLGLDALGTGRSVRVDGDFAMALQNLLADARRMGGPREVSHANAIYQFAHGEMRSACEEWEWILRDAPNDLLALKFAHDAYFYLGDCTGKRDSVARVLPKWKPEYPCYSYLYGMYAFGLEECGEYEDSEKCARKGLEMQPQDAWSTHALAHCMDMNGRTDEGITFMESTVKDWSPCNMLACHNYWHTALFYIEKADYESGLSYFDREIGKRASSGMPLDLVDAASILLRLEMEGVSVGDRWTKLLPSIEPHIHDHTLAFNDAHYRMVIEGANRKDLSHGHRKSIHSFVTSSSGDNCRLTREFGERICEAISAYNKADDEGVIDRLGPIRKNIFQIGGSHTQRDVFTQLLIHSALQSPKLSDKKFAKALIDERNSSRRNSSLSERLLAQFESLHVTDVEPATGT